MTEIFLRTESIKTDEILNLSVINSEDKSIISALKSNEPCLLEGSRGTGKTFLMKVAELELEKEDLGNVCVFVSFNISSLLDTSDPLQFYHWMLAKTLKALVVKLKRRGLMISKQTLSLLSNDNNPNQEDIERDLTNIIRAFENSYKHDGYDSNNKRVGIDDLPDIEDVKYVIEDICHSNNLKRIFFFFDEAAHVFRPAQQRQFFSLYKDLRSPYITCNAAIYPGVTHFGKSFEIIHDCIHKKLERDIRHADYVSYFKEIVSKQINEQKSEQFEKHQDLFSTLVYSCGGNPRILLRTIQELDKINTSNVNSLLKEFYRQKIWSEHTDLGDKYKGHKPLIDWGRDFIEKNVVSAIERYNHNRKTSSVDESTIYFWIHKDCPEAVKEALRLLTYTGIIRLIDSGVRATRAELGSRYEIKYGCVLALLSNPAQESASLHASLSIKKFPEFGKNHQSYSPISGLDSAAEDNKAFHESIVEILKKPISVLQLLTVWQKEKLSEIDVITIEQLYNITEDELIKKIYNVGEVRARIMKNAANAEVLEYISG